MTARRPGFRRSRGMKGDEREVESEVRCLTARIGVYGRKRLQLGSPPSPSANEFRAEMDRVFLWESFPGKLRGFFLFREICFVSRDPQRLQFGSCAIIVTCEINFSCFSREGRTPAPITGYRMFASGWNRFLFRYWIDVQSWKKKLPIHYRSVSARSYQKIIIITFPSQKRRFDQLNAFKRARAIFEFW